MALFKIFKNLFITPILIIAIFILPDILYSFINSKYEFNIMMSELKKLYILSLLFSFLRYKVKIFSIFLIYIIIFFQLSSFSYFGKLLAPFDVWLFFVHFSEVSNGLLDEYMHIVLPFFVVVFSLFISLFVLKQTQKQFFTFKYSGLLLLVALLIVPYKIYNKVYIKKIDSVEKYPLINSASIRNMYKCIGYFCVVTLPRKLSSKSLDDFKDIKYITNEKNPKRNIILILGESLRVKSMSVFDYNKDTTPNLKDLYKTNNIIVKKSISAGTMTKVSVAYLINQVSSLEDINKIYTQDSCLFNLAKSNGFSTSFITNQSANDSRFIKSMMCPKYIDNFLTPNILSQDYDLGDVISDNDMHLSLKNVDLTKPTFLIYQMQGSHTPYSKKSPPKFKKFKHEYDNSVLFTDHSLSKFIKHIKEQKNILPTDIMFVSDHGEMLGENGHSGHGHLTKEVFSVPFIYSSNYENKELEAKLLNKDIVTHYDVSQMILSSLGYKTTDEDNNQEVLVMGKDVDGYAGYAILSISKDDITDIKIYK